VTPVDPESVHLDPPRWFPRGSVTVGLAGQSEGDGGRDHCLPWLAATGRDPAGEEEE
jgi:hypothetical protein